MKLNLTEETEIKCTLKGFYYLVERGKEKLHLFEVILKTPLTHAVSFNCFVRHFQFIKTELLIILKPFVQFFLSILTTFRRLWKYPSISINSVYIQFFQLK